MPTRTTRSTRSHTRKSSVASASSPLPKVAAIPNPRSKSIPKSHSPAPRSKSTRIQPQDVWCICRGSDDRKPMIKCETCNDWFHFACINLSEREAEDIQLYVCDACHSKTGQSTVYDWEGSDAVEGFMDHDHGIGSMGNREINGTGDRGTGIDDASVNMMDDPGDDEDDAEEEASEDDYKEEDHHDNVVVRRGKGTKRITSSDEEEVLDDDHSPSPRAAWRRAQLKRKRGKETQGIQRKRFRKPSSEVGTDDDDDRGERQKKSNNKAKTKHDPVMDPTRKYCLGKLRDILLPIFVQENTSKYFDGDHERSRLEEDTVAELDEEQRKVAEERGVLYVQDLEQCLFEIYGELDKNGQKTAAGKYKDRFRMLSFNLSQPDRYLLRRSIGTNALPALQLSKMSSVDLANEQTKQQIEAANRESLEHSILTQRPVAARAKITHKGEEIIEDLEGDDIGRRIREEEQREREREREREKDAREKAKMLPPPLPPTPKEPSYQGPQDILAQQHSAASQRAAQVKIQHPSPSATSSSTEIPAEPSFKFDDLIAIDLPDDSPLQDTTASEFDTKATKSTPQPADIDEPASPSTSRSESQTMVRPASFDLNHVWSGAAAEGIPQESSASPILSARADDVREPPDIDIDLGTAADDEDFDMFLDKPETATAAPSVSGPEAERLAFEALPVIWSGNINLPDAGKSPAVEARQVGGRPIDVASTQWHILFPSRSQAQLKVDGRVPVKESAKYMTQNRMNITRELIIVALTPTTDRTDYDEVISFLINRDRHAVVHPWGPNPGPDAPGKELYLLPIMPHAALPDYVEILDLVKFPKHRDDNMLLGVFILNKGKFSERAPPASDPHPASGTILRTDAITAAAPGAPSPFTGLHHTAIPAGQLPQQTTTIPPEIVSKLTTEQIESLLQNVLSGGMNVMSSTQLQQNQPQAAPYPPTFPASTSLTNLLPQQFPPASYPPYSGTQASQQYPPQPPHQSSTMPYSYTPPHMSASPPRDQDYLRSPPYTAGGYSRPGRGEFDRPRGRGGRNFSGSDRGRGGHGNEFDRPRDSGWGGRGRGRGGRQQPQSPPRPW